MLYLLVSIYIFFFSIFFFFYFLSFLSSSFSIFLFFLSSIYISICKKVLIKCLYISFLFSYLISSSFYLLSIYVLYVLCVFWGCFLFVFGLVFPPYLPPQVTSTFLHPHEVSSTFPPPPLQISHPYTTSFLKKTLKNKN